MRRATFVALLLLAVGVSSCVVPDPNAPPAARSSGACGTTSAPPARYDHVIWIWMENKTYGQVIHNAAAPYASALADACGTATNFHMVGQPSLPNYIAATSGDTQGVADNASPSSHPLYVDNLFRQVRASGGTEHSYEESMPGNCTLVPAAPYAVKHNPAPYYADDSDRAACSNDNVPFEAFAVDLDRGTLPTFSFITPDLCNDTHDCGVDVGDGWLSQWIERIVASDTYRAGRTAVFIAWDESTPMPFIVVSPSTSQVVYDQPTNHYALLRTTEEMLGLPLLGHAADAASLRDAFRL